MVGKEPYRSTGTRVRVGDGELELAMELWNSLLRIYDEIYTKCIRREIIREII